MERLLAGSGARLILSDCFDPLYNGFTLSLRSNISKSMEDFMLGWIKLHCDVCLHVTSSCRKSK